MRARQCTRTTGYMKTAFILFFALIGFLYIIGYSIWNYKVSDLVEGLNNNNVNLTYYPKKKALNENIKLRFKINDFMKEAIEVPESIKIFKKLIYVPEKTANTTTTPTNGEYAKKIEDSEIYKKFTNDIKPGETKSLDLIYADLFDTTKVGSLDIDTIQKQVSQKMSTENMGHNLVKYFMIQSVDVPYLSNEFSTYFATLINAYKGSSAQLDAIKTFFYKIIGPHFVVSKLVDHYTSNQSTYTSKDDVMFILNTAKEYLQKVKFDDFEHTTTNTVYIFKDDKTNYENNTLTVESLTLFSICSILYKLNPLRKTSEFLKMTDSEFSVMFKTYLEKKFPDSTSTSFFVFAMDPNNKPVIP
jgi:hypothetical protein